MWFTRKITKTGKQQLSDIPRPSDIPPPYNENKSIKEDLQNLYRQGKEKLKDENEKELDKLVDYVVDVLRDAASEGKNDVSFCFFETYSIADWNIAKTTKNIDLKTFSQAFFRYMKTEGQITFEKRFLAKTGLSIFDFKQDKEHLYKCIPDDVSISNEILARNVNFVRWKVQCV